MVNKNNEDPMIQDDSEITYEDTATTDTELEDDEATASQKLKVLRQKLAAANEKSRELHEEVQRTKADFLNARKRLEEEGVRARERDVLKHIDKILPLADSFYLAKFDKEAWEKGDEKWRKGVEGIEQQLLGVLRSYGVESYDPTGTPFDPTEQEAMSTIPVDSPDRHNTVLTVMQLGYRQTSNGTTTVIRPARVTVGEFTTTTT